MDSSQTSSRPLRDYLLLIDALRDLAYVAIVEDPDDKSAEAWALGMAHCEVNYGPILAESKTEVEAMLAEQDAVEEPESLFNDDDEFSAWMAELKARQMYWMEYRAKERASRTGSV